MKLSVKLALWSLAAVAGIGEVASAAPAKDAFVLAKPGAVKPTGWLRDWAETVKRGYTARMEEVDDEFRRAWREDFRPRGKKLHWSQGTWSCEGGAYWFDGLVKLAYQLDDDTLKALAKRRLDPLLDNMTDHPIGFCWWLDRREPSHFQEVYDSSDWMVNWVSGALARPLSAWYAATGDVRAKRALEAALGDDYWNTKFKSQAVDCVPGSVISIPSGAWAAWRETKSEKILAALRTYAEEYARRPVRETYGPAPTNGLEKTLGLKRADMFRLKMPIRHGVVCQESLHSLFTCARLTGDAGLTDAWKKWMDFLYGHAELPFGSLVMDEEWGNPGPRRGLETCALAAESWARVNYLVALGEGRFGDALERATYNAAPASMTRDARQHVYFQTPNRLKAGDCAQLSVGQAGCEQVDYKEKTFPLCCTAGLNRLVPDFVQAMWMTTPDGGVAATLYGPCTFETRLPGGAFAVAEETAYPFDETVTLKVKTAPDCVVSLSLRVPGWCRGMTAAVNGEPVVLAPANGFAFLARIWTAGDTVTLRLPMPARVDTMTDRDETQRAYAYVSSGPILFARGFAEKNANEAAEATGVPVVNPKTVASAAKVVRRPLAHPFAWPLAAPVKVETRDASDHPLTLVPYGCTKLRAALLETTPIAKD